MATSGDITVQFLTGSVSVSQIDTIAVLPTA